MDPELPSLDMSSLEDAALQIQLVELQAQVQLERQRAKQRQKEQRRQATTEEMRRLRQMLQQLQQDRLAYEQARCPTRSSSPHSRCGPTCERNPQSATDKRSSLANQWGYQEEQARRTTEGLEMFSFIGPSPSENTGNGLCICFVCMDVSVQFVHDVQFL